jgi:hypothetical protein
MTAYMHAMMVPLLVTRAAILLAYLDLDRNLVFAVMTVVTVVMLS